MNATSLSTAHDGAAARALRRIKLLHTAAWALFAGSIAAIPIVAFQQLWAAAVVLIALVAMECGVLLLNNMRCPLTAVAARYTDDRRDNFDIYLPLWLARYNKQVFGTWYVLGIALTVVLYLRSG